MAGRASVSDRNYRAFTKAIRESYGVSQADARRSWFLAKEQFGRKPYATDVSKHPALTRRVVNIAKAERAAEKVRKEERGRPPKAPKTLRYYEEIANDYDLLYEEEEYLSSADTGGEE